MGAWGLARKNGTLALPLGAFEREVEAVAKIAVVYYSAYGHTYEQHVLEATLDDLEWADGFAFGTPTRFGGPAAQLKQYLDTVGPLWLKGALANKAATSFSGAMNPHGGQESTILALNNVFYHWGCIIVSVGYTDQSIYDAGGNPYGTSNTANQDTVSEAVLKAAFYQGSRIARVAEALLGLR
jgi:NAD(P)H dehydrogenase (quinone)